MARKLNKAQATAAASRMHAVFGQRSLFDQPKVSAEQVRRAVQGMVERTWRTIPHVRPMTAATFRLVFAGNSAFTTHSWNVAATGMLTVTAVMTLPGLPEDKPIARSVADSYVAYALHEVAHWLYTNPEVWQRDIYGLSRTHGIDMKMVHAICNALEDARIEPKLIGAGYAAGFGHVITGLLDSIVREAQDDRIVARIGTGDPAEFPFVLAYGLRGYVPNGDALVRALPSDLRSIYNFAEHEMRGIAADVEAPFHAGTQRTMQVADTVLTMLKRAFSDRPIPPPNAPDLPEQPQDGEPQDGEPQDGEPQDGEPQDGEPQDGEPQDGEPQDGEPQDGEPGTDESEGTDDDAQGAPQDGIGEPQDKQGAPQGSGYVPPVQRTMTAEDDAVAAEKEPPLAPKVRDAYTLSDAAEHPRCTDPKPETVPGATVNPVDLVGEPLIAEPGKPGESEILSGQQWARGALASVQHSANLRTELRRLFTRTDTASFETGKRSGRLNAGALPRAMTGGEAVFARRTAMDGFDSAVSIVIDQSSSMSGSSIRTAAQCAGVLTGMLAQCVGVRTEVLGFTDASNGPSEKMLAEAIRENERDIMDAFDDEDLAEHDSTQWGEYQALRGSVGRCRLNVFKTFSEGAGIGYARLERCYASGSTPDFEALISAGRRLLKQPAGRRVLIMVTDGQGASESTMARGIQWLKRRGVVVIGLGIWSSCNEAYDYRFTIDELSDLGNTALRALLRTIERDVVGE
jgi:hypothetical protein